MTTVHQRGIGRDSEWKEREKGKKRRTFWVVSISKKLLDGRYGLLFEGALLLRISLCRKLRDTGKIGERNR